MFTIMLALILIRPFISSLAFPFLNFIYSDLLLIFIILWIIFKGVSFKEVKLINVSFLFIALFVSLVFHFDNATGPQELYKYISGILLLVISSTLSYRNKNSIIARIVASGIGISFLAIYQYYFGFQNLANYIAAEEITNPFVLDYISQKRVFYPFITPNALGGYLAMIIPLVLTSKNRFWLAAPLFFALLLTKSIGALLSLFAALTLYLYLQDKLKKRNVFILLGFLTVIGLVFIARAHLEGKHLQPLFSTGMRLSYWQDTLAIIKTHFFTGVGLGNFNLIFSRYSHNSYLQIWAETGILGIISFLCLITAILKSSLKTLKESPDKTRIAGLICASCAFLFHNLIDFSFFLPEISLIWWVILGLSINKNLRPAT